MSRETQCPNCGGPIEFKLGASWAMVCPFCRFSVMRSRDGLRPLGQVADLVPTAPELGVGDLVYVGNHELTVGGRMQLDHGRGPWDEWYVLNAPTQQWGWLSKAQGRWTLTFAVELQGAVPTWQNLNPGQQGPFLPGVPGVWTVAERGQSRLLSAEGELPFPITPQMQGWFADLVGPQGRFATIDYGDGSKAPAAFVGQELPEGALRVGARGMRPAPVQKVETDRLRCPRCGAPVPLFVPETTERIACGSCHGLLDYGQGQLRLLQDMHEARLGTLIPLGREGTLMDEKVMCIAYLERETWVDGQRFTWREFLLHAEGKGYRWLMEDQGHWTWMRPVSAGELAVFPMHVDYEGNSHRIFNRGNATVAYVLGEVYWKVEIGERVQVADFIRPPQMLSEERNDREIVWSVGRYVEPKDVWKGFGLDGSPPPQSGVGFCQPNPWNIARVSAMGAALLAVLLGLFFFFEVIPPHPTVIAHDHLPVPPRDGAGTDGAHVHRTAAFEVPKGPTTLQVALATNVENQYLGVDAVLLNTATGEVHDFYLEAGYYTGFSGERWSEGSKGETAYVDRVDAGSYVMELQPLWERYAQPGGPAGLTPPTAEVSVTVGKRSPFGFGGALALLLLPILIVKLGRDGFEKMRRENSNL